MYKLRIFPNDYQQRINKILFEKVKNEASALSESNKKTINFDVLTTDDIYCHWSLCCCIHD